MLLYVIKSDVCWDTYLSISFWIGNLCWSQSSVLILSERCIAFRTPVGWLIWKHWNSSSIKSSKRLSNNFFSLLITTKNFINFWSVCPCQNLNCWKEFMFVQSYDKDKAWTRNMKTWYLKVTTITFGLTDSKRTQKFLANPGLVFLECRSWRDLTYDWG